MSKIDLRQFNYKEVARYDALMWRAYYNHQFLRMFFYLLKTMRSQLHLNWYYTFKLAVYSGIDATDYRLKRGHENFERIQKYLTRFYKIVDDHALESFDYKKAAAKELEWWNIHRYPGRYDKSLELSLAEAAAVLYKIGPDKLKDYAHYRAMAALMPNHQGDQQPHPADYQEITRLLTKSWRALYTAIQNK